MSCTVLICASSLAFEFRERERVRVVEGSLGARPRFTANCCACSLFRSSSASSSFLSISSSCSSSWSVGTLTSAMVSLALRCSLESSSLLFPLLTVRELAVRLGRLLLLLVFFPLPLFALLPLSSHCPVVRRSSAIVNSSSSGTASSSSSSEGKMSPLLEKESVVWPEVCVLLRARRWVCVL